MLVTGPLQTVISEFVSLILRAGFWNMDIELLWWVCFARVHCISLAFPLERKNLEIVVPFYKNTPRIFKEVSFYSLTLGTLVNWQDHDDVIKWKHFPLYWPFVRGSHRLPVDSLHKGQWRGALMFSLICDWTNAWDAGDLRHHRAHYDVTVMHMDVHY